MLFTIGTSNRTALEFFDELDRRDVRLLVDVRSRPFSRNPWACRPAIEIECTRRGIAYGWSGQLLGGLNSISTTDRRFQVSAEAVLDATDRGPVAMFCAEGDPAHCHRSWKVAAHLIVRFGVVTTNVLRNGQDEDVRLSLMRTRLSDVPECLRDAVQSIAQPILPF